jgi:hypothetical protein
MPSIVPDDGGRVQSVVGRRRRPIAVEAPGSPQDWPEGRPPPEADSAPPVEAVRRRPLFVAIQGCATPLLFVVFPHHLGTKLIEPRVV